MILRFNQGELSVLALHMGIMRQNVRNGFKSNYGKKQGKEMLGSYDEVKQTLEEVTEGLEEENNPSDLHELHFNIREIDMIHSFVGFYYPQLKNTLEAAGKVIGEDQFQLETLLSIRNKVDKLKKAHAV